MSHPVKISIAIPTRNRAEYLQSCLKTCLAPEDADLEVVVSDNNSADTTRAVVAGFNDSRLRYVNTGKSVSMRQNFENALAHATGDYVILIGDDDGVLKHGMQALRAILGKHQPDAITWNPINYRWPVTQPSPEPGIVRFSGRYFWGPVAQKDPARIFADMCNGTITQYREGANIYHGCVRKDVIDSLRAKTGEYFQAHSPDVYASIANLTAAKSLLHVSHPLSVGGESEKSTGAAAYTTKAPTAEQVKTAASFVSLADADTVKPEVSLSVRVPSAYAYASLHRINNLLYGGALRIDHGRWREAILRHSQKLPGGKREENEAILMQLFAEADPGFKAPAPAAADGDGGNSATPAASAAPKRKRYRHVPPSRTQSIASVVEWIDSLTAKPYVPAPDGISAKISRILMSALTDLKSVAG